MTNAFRQMNVPTKLYGLVWVVLGLAFILTAALAAADAIPIDTWEEWSEARIAEVESGNVVTAESMEIEYDVQDDGSRTITNISVSNIKEWRNMLVVPVLPFIGIGVGLLLVAGAYFAGLSIGEHIHPLNATRLLALFMLPLGLLFGIFFTTPFILISVLGIGLLVWSWWIGDDWQYAADTRP